ncbi:transcriptional regulator MtlR [Kroppenstedtia guangzhouensis]|uniref:Transcriptional regulator MtlR n=1 Tax=Kroppenstedtia guangzhouensis TaxID=1274356 RepID=A0ABQ1GEU0_9BACL|nr:BglG family transcription antiterminator [Kroppenstedtia guangzhouensis]GGA42293.1 transcriptional regulator MtlR [Kroppenstedtia guangzhouensis]
MYFSSRERNLIRLLMDSDQAWTVKKLAEVLGVSERTIHRDLSGVETSLDEMGLFLRKKTGVGISLEGDPAGFEALRSALAEQPETEFTPDERKTLLLCTLLVTSEPVKLIALARDLHISPATVSQDLSRIEGWLESFGLTLVKKRGWGVQVTGKERDRRVAMRSLLAEHFDEAEILGILKRSLRRKTGEHSGLVVERLLGMVELEKLSTVEEAVKKEIGHLPYSLADGAYIGLVVHLALAVERIERGETLTFDSNLLHELQRTQEYRIASRIANRLESGFQREFPKSEVGNLTLHLRGAKLGNDRQNWLESEAGTVVETGKLIRRVEQELDVTLADDPSLMQGLMAHLERAVYRMKLNLPIHNPLLSRIEKDYPAVFAAVEQGVKGVFPQYRVPREEIGYLVMHFGSALERKRRERSPSVWVVCASGIGTSKLLVSQLQTEFPEIRRIRNVSLLELQQWGPSEYDLVISTIPLELDGVDVLLVHPYLTKEDAAKIRAYLDERMQRCTREKPRKQVAEGKKKERRMMDHLEKIHWAIQTTLELLKGFSLSSLPAEPLRSILDRACGNLEEAGVLRDRKVVVDRLLERAEEGGLGIPGTAMALFHTRSEEVLRPSFTMYDLTDSIPVEGMDGSTILMDHLLILLAPEQTREVVSELLSRISAMIIESPRSLSVFQSNDEERIRAYLTEHLNGYIYDQIDEQRSV